MSAAGLFKRGLTILPVTSVMAYRESKGLIYLADDQAGGALSSLKEWGIPVEVVKAAETLRPS